MDIWDILTREVNRTHDPDEAARRTYDRLLAMPKAQRSAAVKELLKAAVTPPHGGTIVVIGGRR